MWIRALAVSVIGGFLAVATVPAQHGQHHHHEEPSDEELARLNDEWDRQYARWQQELAHGPEVQPGMVVADIGAGEGGLTLPLAKRVGPSGHVYANDIDPRMLDALRQLRRAEGLTNITVLEGAPDDPLLPEGEVEVAFLLKVYHQLEDRRRFLRATWERLKPGALLFIVDVDATQGWGPGKGSVSDPEDCRANVEAAGFEVVRVEWFRVVDWKLYELVARKPER